MRALSEDPGVDSVLGLARRVPELDLPKVEWARADVIADPLAPFLAGADCVVHLAWLIQPSRDGNLRAVAEARVPSLVHASSVGAYSPGPKDRRVDERWPTDGIGTSFYSRHKAEVERWLDRLERERPELRVVRLRPGLTFKRGSATEQRRYFAGPFLPGPLLRRGLVPFVPDTPGLRFQAVHTDDVAEACRLAVHADARGPFNVAAEPVVGPDELASLLHARKLPVPPRALRLGARLSWRLRLQPTPAGWVDMGLAVPLMDTTRARRELGWEPRRSSLDAIGDVLAGMREGAGEPTPPMEPRSRAEELVTGVGSREWKRD